MKPLSAHQFQVAASVNEAVTAKWLEPLNDAMNRFQINTPIRQAAFIAQVAHESGRFNYLVENLNYSAEALLRVFPKYFTASNVSDYARNPLRIANRVYANRMDNGVETDGNGWKFRGRGLIQITGKRNYQACGEALHSDLLNHPELLQEPILAAKSAGWYWQVNNLNTYADKGDFDGVCDVINIGRKTERYGDSNGFADRAALWKTARIALGV